MRHSNPSSAATRCPLLWASKRYAAAGVPVLPVDAETKRPLTNHGVDDATADVDRILAWAKRWPSAGVAIATGQVSGIVVIDVDTAYDGALGIAAAQERLGALPKSRTVSTPSGGWHQWFRVAYEVTVRNSVKRLGAGVDVRGDGGYAIAPPTRRRSGAGWSFLGRTPLAELPAEWSAALEHGEPRARRMVERGGPSWPLTSIEQGQRNDRLTRLVGHLMGRDVDARIVGSVTHAVNMARCRPPLDADEVDRILESIAGRELRKRRTSA